MKRPGEARVFAGILVGVAVLTVVGFEYARPGRGVRAEPEPRISRADLLPSGTRFRGDPGAPYVLVEFGDYQCPQCRIAMRDVDALLARFPRKLRFAFIYTSAVPATEHPYAERLAMAAEAAGQQGRFWEMHRGRCSRRKTRTEALRSREYLRR